MHIIHMDECHTLDWILGGMICTCMNTLMSTWMNIIHLDEYQALGWLLYTWMNIISSYHWIVLQHYATTSSPFKRVTLNEKNLFMVSLESKCHHYMVGQLKIQDEELWGISFHQLCFLTKSEVYCWRSILNSCKSLKCQLWNDWAITAI